MGTPKGINLDLTQSEAEFLIQSLIECLFPNLRDEPYKAVSERTDDYNCIAWAARDIDNWWWPHEDAFWPHGIPKTEDQASFVAAFKAMGYEECGVNFDLEHGYEKVVLYVGQDDKPKHMARQLPSGYWTSKLGPDWDIEHLSVHGVEGRTYGRAVLAMRRPT
jgi:hypothetical protein